jgi:UDP-galactopyranose mutase
MRLLMSRFARRREVFFLEEPVFSDVGSLQIRPCALTGVQVVTPMLPVSRVEERRAVLDLLLARSGRAIAWYTAPEARAFSGHVSWLATVYDCVGRPSAAGRRFEDRLIQVADLVFAGSLRLYEDRRDLHPNIHCFPQGIEVAPLGATSDALSERADRMWDATHQHMAALLTMTERNAAFPPPSLSCFGSVPAFPDAREAVPAG